MSFNDILRDQVTFASAGTYSAEILEKNNFILDINLSNRKIRFIGSKDDPIYPEIVLWRPGISGSNIDAAFFVECIETEESINFNLNKWKKIALLDVKFNLVIPKKCLNLVRNILKENSLENKIKLQTYEYDTSQLRYIFTL